MNEFHTHSQILPCRAAMQGFSLLEVLVALLVLSVGLLGLAGLSAKGMNSNQSAYYLSQAMVQAYDMADRMRANRAGFAAGSYDSISGTGSDPGCISTGCSTTSQIAQYDANRWNTANANLLPSGRGTVAVQAGNIRIITVMWDDQRTGATGTACGSDPT
ncbi:MAG TPA: type IV pilus modification protein PilV, partial [Gammaproteobacteria bacterium]|nr:type IV pilus modification protein PilV [Gammaproteobacteria bacterium]